MGDIHYSGIYDSEQNDFEYAYFEVFNKIKTQSEFYRS